MINGVSPGTATDAATGVPLIGSGRSRIEIEHFVTAKTVEKAYMWAREQANIGGGHVLAARGFRCAKARDPKILLALEKGAEVMHVLAESQYGRTTRDPGSTPSERVWSTEAALWREAYATADRGDPCQELAWIYAAAARLAGLL